jgi:ABC-type uncharacterized transport system auxiliary subunit
MNSNTHSSRTAASARRALPVLAIAALAIGLAACQTPPEGLAQPKVEVISAVNPPVRGVTTGQLLAGTETAAKTTADESVQVLRLQGELNRLQLVIDTPTDPTKSVVSGYVYQGYHVAKSQGQVRFQ